MMKYQGLALMCSENERPLQGLIGKLDWKFSGAFTHLLRTGVITGKKGELCYHPLKWNEVTYHFLILGRGPSKQKLEHHELKVLKQNITSLGLSNIAIEGETGSEGELEHEF